MKRLAVLLVAAVLLLTACPDDGDPTVGADGTTTSSTPGSTGSTDTSVGSATSSPTVACPANTEKQEAPPVAPRALHTDLRAAHQPGFDRIVFEFTGAAPGYVVEYVPKPLHEDGSGNEVTLRGQFALQVRMENASGYDFDRQAPSYTGSNRVRPSDTTVVEELVRTGDFEGILTWAIGLKAKNGFRVRQLSDPPRLQVEICAAP